MTSPNNPTEKKPTTHGIFYVKPIKNSNSMKIKCAGIIKENEKVIDEPIECGYGDDKYLCAITDEIYVRIYRCNIPDWFLMSTRTLPILCATVLYQTPIIKCNLFNLLIEFNITTKVESEKQLINNNLEGTYQMRMDTKNHPLKVALDKYENTKKMVEMMIELIKQDSILNIAKNIIGEKRSERIQKLGGVNAGDVPIITRKLTDLVKDYTKNGKIEL